MAKTKSVISKAFKRCTKSSKIPTLTASKIYLYTRSPYQLYCNWFAPESQKDPEPSPFQERIMEDGNIHERAVNKETFPDITPIEYDTAEQGFQLGLEAMYDGVPALLGTPMFYLPYGMHGHPDQLVKKRGKSAFGNHHYIVKEIKNARNIRHYHILQAAFYNRMIGMIQNYTPKTFYIIDMDKKDIPFQYADYTDELDDAIFGALQIKQGKVIPPPKLGSCGYPWSSYCDKMAHKTGDLSIIPGIGDAIRDALVDHGVKSIRNIISVGEKQLCNVPGIGPKYSKQFVDSARAIKHKKVIRRTEPKKLVKKKTEVFFDFEGLAGESEYMDDYLIGCLIRKGKKEEYVPFVAKDEMGEEKMLVEFLEFLKTLDDYVLYHWGSYERTHMIKIMKKYGISQRMQRLVLGSEILVNLHNPVKEAFAFPLSDYGLKSIARWLGFEWEHKDVDANASVMLYQDYLQTHDDAKLDLILDYNRDDCIATRIVKDWYTKQ